MPVNTLSRYNEPNNTSPFSYTANSKLENTQLTLYLTNITNESIDIFVNINVIWHDNLSNTKSTWQNW